jgi:hypothetical protein
MGWIPSYGAEASIYANYILANLPNAKIAVLYQNDDFGKDYLNGLRKGLGDKAAKMIVATQSRSDRRFANCIFARQRCRCAANRGDTEVCGPGNSQSLRHRMAAYSLSDLRIKFRWNCDEVCWTGKRSRHHLRGVRKGPHRPAVAGNNGIPGVVGVYEDRCLWRETSRHTGRDRFHGANRRCPSSALSFIVESIAGPQRPRQTAPLASHIAKLGRPVQSLVFSSSVTSNRWRARARRDITVPIGTSVAWAISR